VLYIKGDMMKIIDCGNGTEKINDVYVSVSNKEINKKICDIFDESYSFIHRKARGDQLVFRAVKMLLGYTAEKENAGFNAMSVINANKAVNEK